MSEPKKLVIKINRGKSRTPSKDHESSKNMVTEWHYGRIIGSLCLLLTVIATLTYLALYRDNSSANNEAKQSVSEIQLATQQMTPMKSTKKGKEELYSTVEEKLETNAANLNNQKKVVEPLDIDSEKSDPKVSSENEAKSNTAISNIKKIIHYNVPRALLASGIANKEPFGEIISPVTVNSKQATGIFYFTEIKNMKGRIFYHQWIQDGKLALKKEIKVAGNRWRAASSKLMTLSSIGNWKINMIDEDGKVYSQLALKVVAE